MTKNRQYEVRLKYVAPEWKWHYVTAEQFFTFPETICIMRLHYLMTEGLVSSQKCWVHLCLLTFERRPCTAHFCDTLTPMRRIEVYFAFCCVPSYSSLGVLQCPCSACARVLVSPLATAVAAKYKCLIDLYFCHGANLFEAEISSIASFHSFTVSSGALLFHWLIIVEWKCIMCDDVS